jgi:hypothetical protein
MSLGLREKNNTMNNSSEQYFTLNQDAIESMRLGNLEAYLNKLLTIQTLRNTLQNRTNH